MRVLLINTSERMGGAAIAAGRLMEALKNHGIKAKMLVRDKQTDEITVVPLRQNWWLVWKFVWERIVIWTANRFSRKNLFAVDIANTGTDITTLPEFQQADIIHLHWINQGMLSLRDIEKILRSGKHVVWTMHDLWPCTGICHYTRGCERYRTECGHCPFIDGGRHSHDLAWRVFRRKRDIYAHRNIHFVTCSNWLGEQARRSSLLAGHPVTVIPNPINTNLFKPHNKAAAREKCRLPQDKMLMLFGSVKITDKPFRVYPLDFVRDDHRLVDIYNAVDIFVTPSLEDNLPNTIMEAMACGTPCVGFNTGGIPEMIDHLHNGYVAAYKSAEDFANGIYWTLTDPGYPSLAEQACRKAVAYYSENTVARRFIELYNKL